MADQQHNADEIKYTHKHSCYAEKLSQQTTVEALHKLVKSCVFTYLLTYLLMQIGKKVVFFLFTYLLQSRTLIRMDSVLEPIQCPTNNPHYIEY